MIAALLVCLILGHTRSQQPAPERIRPQSFDQISQAAVQALNENRDDEAIALFQQALKLKYDWNEGLLYLGTLFYDKERFSEARNVLRRLVAQNDKYGPAFALLGLSEYKTREWERALQHLQRAQKLGLENRAELTNAVFYHQATLLTRFEQYHDSLAILYQLRELGAAPDSLEDAVGLAALAYPLLPEEVPEQRQPLIRMAGKETFARFDHKNAEAEQLLRKMVQDYPAEPGVHYQYGLLLMLTGRSAEALPELEKELGISPWHVPSRLRLAEYYLTQSQPEKAQPYLDEVLKIEPNNASAHLLRGEQLQDTGDTAGAIHELELARQQAPDRKKVLWALFRAYAAAGRRVDADEIKARLEKLNEVDIGE